MKSFIDILIVVAVPVIVLFLFSMGISEIYRKKYISYNKEGLIKYHYFLLSAIMRAKYYKTFVDIEVKSAGCETGILKSIRDYREY